MKKKTLFEQIKEWMKEHTDLPYVDEDRTRKPEQFGYNDFCIFIQKNLCTAQYLRHGHPTILVEFKFTDLDSYVEGYNSIYGKVHVELEKELQTVLNSVNHWMYNQKHLDKKNDSKIVWELIQFVMGDDVDEMLEKDGTTTFVLMNIDLVSNEQYKNFQISFLGTNDLVINLDEEGLMKAYIGFTTFE